MEVSPPTNYSCPFAPRSWDRTPLSRQPLRSVIPPRRATSGIWSHQSTHGEEELALHFLRCACNCLTASSSGSGESVFSHSLSYQPSAVNPVYFGTQEKQKTLRPEIQLLNTLLSSKSMAERRTVRYNHSHHFSHGDSPLEVVKFISVCFWMRITCMCSSRYYERAASRFC